MARPNEDSKTFVDMKLKVSPLETYRKFRIWKRAHPNPSTADVRRFVRDNFDREGSEFQKYVPSDYVKEPAFLRRIADPMYRQFASALNAYWPQLGRNMTDDVARRPELYSIIHVPNAVVVPGGRFREFYYWDTYWILLGLLHSEMTQTARGMLQNFLSIVDRFGFIPNGGRIYYMGRSQPPLLIPMMKQYVDATGDWELIRQSMGTLEREFAYWFAEDKVVHVRQHRMSRYSDRAPGPRPESYWEDVELAAGRRTESERAAVYAELRAGAESGMDYTSRWFIAPDGTNNGTMEDLNCHSIVPVELNAVLWWNAEILGEFHERLGNVVAAARFRAQAIQLYAAIQEVFWNEEAGVWLDWNLQTNAPRDYFVPTNLSPLWVGAFDAADRVHITERMMKYINRIGIDQYEGGVPNTMMASGEQWDFPNVWAPMQHMLIIGLSNLRTPEAEAVALRWAERWVYTNYVAYDRSRAMFEKYSAVEVGLGGGGGEYEIQLGFGWSNGVVLDLLDKYGEQLRPKVRLNLREFS